MITEPLLLTSAFTNDGKVIQELNNRNIKSKNYQKLQKVAKPLNSIQGSPQRSYYTFADLSSHRNHTFKNNMGQLKCMKNYATYGCKWNAFGVMVQSEPVFDIVTEDC